MRYLSEFFFFKQKTAYEMRISDWSSDVCSSDLNVIEDIRELRPPVNGQDLVLSVDADVQYIVLSELKKAVEQHKAKAAAAVVLDAKTDRKSTRLHSSHYCAPRMPSSAWTKKAHV